MVNHFIQKTFAEYFAAHCFSQNYKDNQKVLTEIIFSPCYDVKTYLIKCFQMRFST
jgi:hypothetical protein